MNDDFARCYELLGVAPGASGRELKEAYRDLAKVWHPDRFSHDPRLQQKAQEKLKAINEAYDRLTTGRGAGRSRPASTPGTPHAPAAAARSRRPWPLLMTAAVFCAVFFAALSSLAPRGARQTPDQTPPAEATGAPAPDEGRRPEGGARAAADRPTRGKEMAARPPAAEATSAGGGHDPEPDAQRPRPLPTVTVRIDAETGQLATQDCPLVSTMTYPAGGEPQQHCTARHKPETGAQGSRLKSAGKRLAAPLKWLGGGRGADAVETQDAQPPGGDRSKNR